MKASLLNAIPESKKITSFIFEPERPVKWKAGQFLRYVLPHSNMDDRGDGRYFTVSSAPYEKYLRITTRFSVPSSTFKKALEDLQIGDEIQIDEPEGEFVVNNVTKNYIFVAGGIGITPVLSILSELDNSKKKIKAHVLYGTSDKRILFKNQLDDFSLRNSDLTVEYILDSKNALEPHLTGAIQNTLEPYVYITGPEPMVEWLTVVAKKAGVDIRHIQTDFFSGYKSI